MERRKDQYAKVSGYFITPLPYALPGIGSGLGAVFMANNIGDSYTDILGTVITGDVQGAGLGVSDLYLIEKTFKVEFFYQYMDKASFQSYKGRGMDTKKEDYSLIYIDSMEFLGTKMTLSFFEKMLEFYVMTYSNSFALDSIRDKEGNVIVEAKDGEKESFNIYNLGTTIDYTDDKLDPRRGVRLDLGYDYSPAKSVESADYYVSSYNLTGYIPMGQQSTWAFNYFVSDAHVMREGETDFDTIAKQISSTCDQNQECIDYVNNTIASNRYGSSTSLGGRSRLRSYTQGRFSGAHTRYYGTEFRWNLTDESTEFDIFFMKDIRTNIQAAFFYEKGSVADKKEDLGKGERYSYGAGIRMLTGSGWVYRLDVANGEDGSEATMILNYPWELF